MANKRTARSAQVIATRWVTPDLLRVTFGGADVGSLEPEFTDSYIKLLFPPAGAPYAWPFDPEQIREQFDRALWPVTRTYTIRSLDRAAQTMEVDFVVHGDTGLAGAWAKNARAGDSIGFLGPGGAWSPDPAADLHVLVGDEAAMPAIGAALDALGDRPAKVFVEVSGPDAEGGLPAGADITWVHRDGLPGHALVEAVRAAGVPDGDVRWFVHGVAEMIKDLRRFLFVDHGVAKDHVHISGYWRIGMTENDWQASKRDFVAEMEATEAVAQQGR
ncbi:siderophore-interacting protein [Granulicoccus phenolivorans]|uniref:siderophore-interacting protein n=1 Tax=Granulicoccus phenolivorans TaxID=266854 RepID=UPI0003FDCEF0|nr:siderophore-interacting protein [Granulicoccus phenolivorans]